jgi:cysteine desulfurase
LVFKKSYPISPIVVGGSQNESLHAGTYNLPAIVALSHAVEMVNRDEYLGKYQSHTQTLRQKLEDFVKNNGGIVVGEEFDRISNTSCIAKIGVPSTEQLMIFDQNNICVSVGSACSAGVVSKSTVLKAMNLSDEIVGSVVRVSLGLSNTEGEIDEFCRVWRGL